MINIIVTLTLRLPVIPHLSLRSCVNGWTVLRVKDYFMHHSGPHLPVPLWGARACSLFTKIWCKCHYISHQRSKDLRYRSGRQSENSKVKRPYHACALSCGDPLLALGSIDREASMTHRPSHSVDVWHQTTISA